MKKSLVSTALIATTWAAASSTVMAQSAAPAPEAKEAQSTLAFNAGVVSDYRYRGISQSRLQPAVQGGLDYTDKSGLYVGAWGSSIKWIKDSGASAGAAELDLYAGYKGAAADVSYDLGVLRYEYLGNKYQEVSGVNANTNEVYGSLGYGPFTFKYSHATSNLFGNANSKNSHYLDLSASFDLGQGYTLSPHVGRQVVKNADSLSYTDYALTLGKDLGEGLSASLMLVGSNAERVPYTLAGKFNGKSAAVVGLKYTF